MLPKPMRRLPRVEAVDQAVRWTMFVAAIALTCWWYYFLARLAWSGLAWLASQSPAY